MSRFVKPTDLVTISCRVSTAGVIEYPFTPKYADDTAANADVDLKSGEMYWTDSGGLKVKA